MREFNQNGQRVISQAKDLPEVLTKFIAEKGGKLSQLDAVVRDGTPRIAKLFGIQKPGDYAFAEAEGNWLYSAAFCYYAKCDSASGRYQRKSDSRSSQG